MRRPQMVLVVVVVGCASAVSPSLKPPVIDPTVALQTACDRGEAKSCTDLGNHLSRWNDVPHDESRAVRTFARGCDLGWGEACASAALMFEAGRGVPLDLREALALHARACALGYSWSCKDQRRLAEYAELPGELTRDPRCEVPCVSGGLEKDDIFRVMQRRQGSVQYCYHLALDHNEGLTAHLTTKFVIDAEGGVQQIETPNATDPELAACVTAVLRTFRFPRPIGGGVVNVTFPYLFRTPESLDAGSSVSR